MTARLARAWGCSPVELRDATLGEINAMANVLEAENRARPRGAR